MNILSKHYDDQWKQLQQLKSTKEEKERAKIRILNSIQVPTKIPSHSKPFFQWKSILATCLLFLICGGFWLLIQQESSQERNSSQEIKFDYTQFNWQLNDVYSKKTKNGLSLYRKNNSLRLGTVNEVTKSEMNKIINHLPISVEEKLEHFPYPTKMYIEHVKMMDVAIRYHFFITIPDQHIIHFTFDYPKIEYADIFIAISTLQYKGISPYIHSEQLYVKHGYGKMIFPVDLKPISISSNKEVYHWENASSKSYKAYLEKITGELGNYKKKSTKNGTNTFVSTDGNEIVTISREGKTITYEFFYPNQDG